MHILHAQQKNATTSNSKYHWEDLLVKITGEKNAKVHMNASFDHLKLQWSIHMNSEKSLCMESSKIF